ncbi:hypothetical protein VYU27_000565 [Nannochloropsis oceanica]
MSAFLEDDVAYGKRALSDTGSEETLERTYDLLWHDLIQHRSGKGGEADKTIMPKIMRELAPGGTFFDPRVVWEAEKDRLIAATEEAKRKEEEAEKQRLEEEKKQERLQNRMKKMAITTTRDEGGKEGGEESAATTSSSRAPSPVSAPEDLKWRQELATKIKLARQTVKGEYGEGEVGGQKAEGAFNDFVGKLEKLWGDSIKASSKSQKTEIEKKLEKMAKTAVKQLKEAKEEEVKAGGGGPAGGQKKKSAVIREKLEAKKQVDDVENDAQLLSNTLSKFKRTLVPSLLGLKENLKSPHGRLQWMLEVIKASLGQRPRDDVLILDCLFALIELPMFVSARKEVKAREKERKKAKESMKGKKEKEGKDGKKSKKDKDKREDEEELRFAPLSREGELVARFSDTIDEVMGLLGDIDDVIEFQLVKMANCLPPLSRFSFGRSLDGWQKKVLGLIDQKRSVIVCAPTSSGKTVLSSYVTMRAEKILFVVPTEPLVWQVAAMFYKVLGGEVAVVTNQIVYNPKREDPKDWRCIVGTPLALESALSKPRGREGAEMLGQQDFSIFRGGFHEFEYVIYDEVHTLDGDEGAALQRIIKGVRCNFLALSATIGNGIALREWWQGVHDAHVADEVAEVEAMLEGRDDATREEGEDYDMLARLLRMKYAEIAPAQGTSDVKALKGRWSSLRAKCREAANASSKVPQDVLVRVPPKQTTVELVDHKARFINLQRWVWVENKLKTLHPLAAMSIDFLTQSKGGEGGGVGGVGGLAGFQEVALPFTPYDSFKLWEALRAEFEEEVIEDVDPEEILGGKRITLERSKDYEDILKVKLTTLARQGGKAEAKVKKVLETFAPPPDATASESYRLLDVVQHMKDSGFFPAIFFRLDTYSCVELLNELLKQVEAAEKIKYPTYYADLTKKKEAREELARKARDAAEKRKDKKVKKRVEVDESGNRVEAEKDEENPADAIVNVPPPVDDTAPHPDFVLSSPVNRITDQELSDMLDKLAKDHMDAEHPYIKGLRRGIGLYVDDSHTQEYRRIVQSLAQQGKLAVVFSDHSLAYGVNMPFRTSTFVGDDPELLTPLMAAQMSGRAGRRGLDEQGNLVYLGMPWERMKVLMLGCIPAIRGREPRYPTMALQHVLSQHYNRHSVAKTDRVRFFPEYINEVRMKAIAGPALEDFLQAREAGAELKATPHPCDDVYYKRSLRALEALRFIKVEKAEAAEVAEDEEDLKEVVKAPGVLALLWELREYPAEGVAVVHALPWMMKKVRPTLEKKTAGLVFKQWSRRVKIDDVERIFLTMLLPLIDREAPKPGVTPLHQETFVTGNPARADICSDVEELLRRSQARVQEVDEADRVSLLLERQPAASAGDPPTPLDSTLFKLLVMRRTPGSDPTLSALTSVDWFRLKQRLWKVGSVVRLMHNCLGKAGDGSERYAVFLLWKTFRRIWHIMRDLMVYGTKWVGGEEGLGAGAGEDGGSDGEEVEEGGSV